MLFNDTNFKKRVRKVETSSTWLMYLKSTRRERSFYCYCIRMGNSRQKK